MILQWPGGICPNTGECCFPNTYPKQNDFTVQYIARTFPGDCSLGGRFYTNAVRATFSVFLLGFEGEEIKKRVGKMGLCVRALFCSSKLS